MTDDSDVVPARDDRIIAHAVLAGLASAIPIPLLDDAVKDRVQRRMVADLAERRGVALTPEEVALLADDKSAFVAGAIKSLALWPLKKALQKTFLVLGARRVVALASECYQRGLLLDHAFSAGACAPDSRHSPTDLRKAVDDVLEQVRGGPIERALVAGLGESRQLVSEGLELLLSRVRAWRGRPSDAMADRAAEELTREGEPGVAAIADRLRRAMADVGGEHFEDLFRRLDERLERGPEEASERAGDEHR
ncbi:MAG: hypothetical protein JRI23_12850 [Deltaproteobacteria bacterium]|nr:hypothetical protein [Deltaproteobacteria bacterium]MBW2532603.1 hypothetical protein [Deltaproteobacteria bacterium]